MKYLLIFLSFIIALTGCSSTSYYHYHDNPSLEYNLHYKVIPVYMDQSFSKEDVVMFEKVIGEWNYVFNGQMKVVIAKGTFDHNNEGQMKLLRQRLSSTQEGFLLIGANHTEKIVEPYLKKESGGIILAFCDGIGDTATSALYVLRDRVGMKNLHQILLHEFGHALGSDHTSAYSLMFPQYGAGEPDCVDKITAAQIAGFQHLNLSHMNYCAIPNFE